SGALVGSRERVGRVQPARGGGQQRDRRGRHARGEWQRTRDQAVVVLLDDSDSRTGGREYEEAVEVRRLLLPARDPERREGRPADVAVVEESGRAVRGHLVDHLLLYVLLTT